MTNNQLRTDHGAHCHRPLLVLPDLQAKAAVMKAEAEAVTVGDVNKGGGGSGGDGSGEWWQRRQRRQQQWWVHRQEQSTIN